MPDIKVDALKDIINSSKPCFVIGNGINRYNYSEDGPDISWEGILKQIYRELVANSYLAIEKGISLPEFYNVLELLAGESVKSTLQERFASLLNFEPQNHHLNIVKEIRDRQCQILTTNFDSSIENAALASMYRYRVEGLRLLSDYYPWDSYYSTEENLDPFNSFSIWHMQGQKKYKRSIKLGFDQYISSINKAGKYRLKQEGDLRYRTWLDLFFNKDLVIFGLGLEEQELFIRHLLMERAKRFKRKPELKKRAFYVNHDAIDKTNNGKKFFLNAVGVEYVDFIGKNGYEEFYEGFWSQL